MPGRVVAGLICLVCLGLALTLLGLSALWQTTHITETNPEWAGDQAGVGVMLTVLLLPPGVACLAACVPFFLSARRRWLWSVPICVALLPLAMWFWLASEVPDDSAFSLVGAAISLALAAVPVALSLVGMRGRWRPAE